MFLFRECSRGDIIRLFLADIVKAVQNCNFHIAFRLVELIFWNTTVVVILSFTPLSFIVTFLFDYARH